MIGINKKRPARALAICLAVLMTLVFTPLAGGPGGAHRAYADAPEPWDGGADVSWYLEADSGEDVFEINTVGQLAGLARIVNDTAVDGNGVAIAADTFEGKTVQLKSDIYASGAGLSWTPIGTSANPFKGAFDGKGKTITLNIDTESEDQGVFGYVDTGSTVSDLIVEGSVKGLKNIGGVAGRLAGGTLEKVTNRAKITGTNTKTTAQGTGGIVGYISSASHVNDAVNHGAVEANFFLGGIIGYVNSTTVIEDVVNYGAVSCSGVNTGGIVGYFAKATMSDAVNHGAVTSSSRAIGGVIGNSANDTNVTRLVNTGDVETTGTGNFSIGGVIGETAGVVSVRDSYNTGNVTGSLSYMGGIVGKNGTNTNSVVDRCFNTGKITGTASGNIGGIVGNNPGIVKNSINIGIVSSTSGATGGISGTTTGTYPDTDKNYYLKGSAVGGNSVGTELGDEDLRPIVQGLFPGSVILNLIDQQLYQTKIMLNVYRQVGSDGISVLEEDYTLAELDQLADITEKAGYLHGYRLYKTKNAVTLEKLVGDALDLNGVPAFTGDAKYVVAGTDGDGPAVTTFTYDDLTSGNNFYPATSITGTNNASIVTDTAGAHAVKPALAMTATLDPIPIKATAGIDIEDWDGVVSSAAVGARTMQFLVGTSEDNYLGRVSDVKRFLTGVDSITVIRYADETLVQIAERLADKEKEVAEIQQKIDEVKSDLKKLEQEKQQSTDGAEQAAEKAKLEAEKAKLQAEKTKLEKEKAEIEAETEKLQGQVNEAKQQAFESAGAKIAKLSASKNSATITWSKIAEAEGYQIVYAPNKAFTNKKTLTIKSGTTVKTTIKNLTKGKTYYFKIRAYTKIANKTVYTKYSPTKKLKLKK
jgi:hypothetical protein